MKKYWIIIFLIILAFFFIEFDTIDVDQNSNDQSMIAIKKENIIGQTFLSKHNNLCKVEVCLGTSIETETQDIVFHLRSDPNTKVDISEITINLHESEDIKYFEFNFRPIENSKDKNYYFFLESIGSENIIFVFFNSEDVYLNGTTYANHMEKGGDLQFRTYYKSRPIYIIVHFFERAFQDITFFIFYLFLILFFSFILFRSRYLLKEIKGNKDRKIKNFLKYAFLLNFLFFGLSLKLQESKTYPIYSINWINSIIAGETNSFFILQFFSLIFTIVLGSLTFWTHKEVFRKVETEQHSELQKEEKRKRYFPYAYPKIDRIPIFNSIVKWMYKEGWYFSICLLVLTFVGFGLRIYGVGDFNFREDEFQVINTASSFHFGGGFHTWDWIKDEPSGYLYMRAWPHTLLIAKSFDVFGISEFSARLITVIFGTILIFESYFITKYFTNSKKIAILTSFAFALNSSYISMSRYARMYGIMLPIFIIVVYLLYRGIIESHRLNPKSNFIEVYVRRIFNFNFGFLLIGLILLYFSYLIHINSLIIIPTLLIFLLCISIFKREKKYIILILGFVIALIYYYIFSMGNDKRYLTFFDIRNFQYPEYLTYPFNISYGEFGLTLLFFSLIITFAFKRKMIKEKIAYLMTIVVCALIFFTLIADRYPTYLYISHVTTISTILIITSYFFIIALFDKTLVRVFILLFLLGNVLLSFYGSIGSIYFNENQYGKFNEAYADINLNLDPNSDVIFGQYLRTYYLRELSTNVTIIGMSNNQKYEYEKFLGDLIKYESGWITWETRKTYHINDKIVAYICNNDYFIHVHGELCGDEIDNTRVEVFYFNRAESINLINQTD